MILVDPRVGTTRSKTRAERLEDLIARLRRRVNCPVKGKQMDAGDFCFSGHGPNGLMAIGIELKEIRDFCSSMRSDRLAGDQIVGMSEMYEMAFVIIQGLWRPGKDDLLEVFRGGKGAAKWQVLNLSSNPRANKCFHYAEVFKHQVSLTVKKNVVVIRSTSEDETAWQIAHLYSWWQTPWEQHRSTDPIKLQTEVMFTRVSTLRKMAAELLGIGWTRSLAVEKAFRSVFAMVNAPVESWEAIDGIGPKTARNVWNTLREKK